MERFDRTHLHIGTYILQPYAQTEAHVKEMAEAGVDLLVCLSPAKPEVLDWLEKYNIKAIVSGVVPGWWGGNGDCAGKMQTQRPLTLVSDAAARFADHPAICGIDIGDEPSALDFPHYGAYARATQKYFPKQFPYLNLYPNYASVAKNSAEQTVSQLGTATYAEHIDKYCQYLDLDYICYDYYMYSASVAGAYENLRIVADAAQRTGRSMWIVLQVNSSKEEKRMSENMLRFQAYSAMAFGAEVITWACWTGGWWYNNVLDTAGNKTEQYEKLKKVNAEILQMADIYMQYRRTDTHFLGFAADDPEIAMYGKDLKDVLNTGVFLDVRAANGKYIVGEMAHRDALNKSRALMICAADDSQDRNPNTGILTFSAPGRVVTWHSGHGKRRLTPDDAGVYRVELPSCEGALITAE